MQRIPVSSSNIRSVGYESVSQTLEVEFNNGGVYQYYGVSESRYSGLMSAGSKGSYFDSYIKKAGYRCSKIR